MRETNRMRVELDFIVEFRGPLRSLPMGTSGDIKLLYDHLTEAMRERRLRGADRIMPGGGARFSLDFRRPKRETAAVERVSFTADILKRLRRRSPFTMREWLALIQGRIKYAMHARRMAKSLSDPSRQLGWLIRAAHCAVRAAVMAALLPGHEARATELCACARDWCIEIGEHTAADRMVAMQVALRNLGRP